MAKKKSSAPKADLETIAKLGKRLDILNDVAEEKRHPVAVRKYVSEYTKEIGANKTQQEAYLELFRKDSAGLQELAYQRENSDKSELVDEVEKDPKAVISELPESKVVAYSWHLGGKKEDIALSKAAQTEDYSTTAHLFAALYDKDAAWAQAVALANKDAVINAAQIYVSKRQKEFAEKNLSRTEKKDGEDVKVYDQPTATSYLAGKVDKLKKTEKPSMYLEIGKAYADKKNKK